MTAAALRIQMLGWPEVLRRDPNGQGEIPVAFPALKTQALLYYLILARRSVARETLMALLWPESDLRRAQTSLRTALHQLQRVLPKGALETNRHQVRLRVPSSWEVDVFRLEALLDAPPTPETLRQAIALYRGDFLEGFHIADAPEFTHWRTVEGERLRARLLDALNHGIQQTVNRGMWDEAERLLRFAVRLEPWREDLHVWLMRVLAWQGRYAEALKHYQVCQEALQREIDGPPGAELQRLAKSIRARQANPPPFHVPPLPTEVIGREADLAALHQHLTTHQMVSIVGPGGTGKTLLALAFAHRQRHRYPDGVGFVPLESISQADFIAHRVAEALGIPLRAGIPATEQVRAYLEPREMLLVLDNLEHLPDAGVVLAQWLQSAPDLRLLITSHQPLGLRREAVYPLAGLTYPPDAAPPPAEYAAGQLFLACARRAATEATPQAVARLCRLLDGMPLALELAAAGLQHTPGEELVAALSRDLDLLQAQWPDAPPRHRSLRAVFHHTWQHLSPDLQAAFTRLAVFQETFTAAAAGQVTDVAPAMLHALQESGLLQCVGEETFRLHPTLRRYAREQLEALSELTRLKESHARYYLTALGRLPTPLTTDDHRALRRDLAEVQAAWLWAAERGMTSLLQSAAAPLHRFYEMQGWYAEGAAAFAQARDHLRAADTPADTAWGTLMAHAAALLLRNGRLNEALEAAQQAVDALQTAPDNPTLIFALNVLGVIHLHQGDFAAGRRTLEAVVETARRQGQTGEQLKALVNLGSACLRAGEYARALEVLAEGRALARQVGDRAGEAFCLVNLGGGAALLGDLDAAWRDLEDAVTTAREAGIPNVEMHALVSLAAVSGLRGDDPARVAAYAQQGVELARKLGDPLASARALAWLGWARHRQGAHDEGWQRLREAAETLGSRLTPTLLYVVERAANLWAAEGQADRAAKLAAFVAHHPAAEQQTADWARQLLASLGAAPDPPEHLPEWLPAA